MKKVIAALDGLKLSQSTLHYAISAAKLSNAHLVGVFLEDFTYHSYLLSEVLENGALSDDRMESFNQKDRETRDHSVATFEEACQEAGLNYSVHRDRNIAIQDLLHESIYSDLLVIDAKETFTRLEESLPTRYIRDLLTDVQCPVLVVPHGYRAFKKAVILYDGEPSSVHAVKMFSYLFPALHKMPVEILSIKEEEQSLHVPDNRLIKEFMKRHYPEANYTVMKGDPDKKIVSWLEEQNEAVLVVLGAYRRSRVSRWFKTSMADHLMANLAVPLFIAHNK